MVHDRGFEAVIFAPRGPSIDGQGGLGTARVSHYAAPQNKIGKL